MLAGCSISSTARKKISFITLLSDLVYLSAKAHSVLSHCNHHLNNTKSHIVTAKYILLFSDSECPIEDEDPDDSFEIEYTENGQYRTSLHIPRLAVTCFALICSLQRSVMDYKYSTYLLLTDFILRMWLVPRAVCVIRLKIQPRPRFVFHDKDMMDVLVLTLFIINMTDGRQNL